MGIVSQAYDNAGCYRRVNSVTRKSDKMPNCIRSFVDSTSDTSAAEISNLIGRCVDVYSSYEKQRKKVHFMHEAWKEQFEDDLFEPEFDTVRLGVSEELDELRRIFFCLPDISTTITREELKRVPEFIKRNDVILRSLTVQ